MMRKVLLAVGIAVGMLVIVTQANAQEKNVFMYGTVTTISGDAYTGPIRWGSDEVYWMETFNAQKTSNDFLRFLSKQEAENISNQSEGKSWMGINWRSLNIWEDKFSRSNHQFDTQFGDIKSVEPTAKDKARLTLKNGVILEVNGSGYEDVGTSVRIYDEELGEVKLNWSRIEKVDFMEPAKTPSYSFGKPIYARVNAGRKGTFEGLIQWDKDERFMEEVLDGKDRNGDKEIPFRSISKIVKGRSGAEVTLHSGRQLVLTGTRDVNSNNAGIVVNAPGLGQVTIPWRDFEEMEILDKGSGLAYSDFPVSQGLSATIVTVDGDEHNGLIAFDLDEAWEFEILDAKDDNVEFKIPMRNIKNIIPKNSSYSTVVMRNGTDWLLGDHRDVSESNSGVLIFTSKNSDPVYVRWSRIDEIIFD